MSSHCIFQEIKNYMNVMIYVINMLKLNCNNALLIKGQQQATTTEVSALAQSVEDVKGTLTEPCTLTKRFMRQV